MTIDEAIRYLSVHSSTNGSGLCTDEQHYEAKQIAIKALDQEPCGDAISRDAVLEKAVYTETEEGWSGYTVDVEYIKSLQTVTPQPRTVLYSGDGYADGYMVYDMAECPNCGYEYEDGDKDWGLSFCPNCGQKLNWERSE